MNPSYSEFIFQELNKMNSKLFFEKSSIYLQIIYDYLYVKDQLFTVFDEDCWWLMQ